MCVRVDILTYFQLPNEFTTSEQWFVAAHLTNIMKWRLTKKELNSYQHNIYFKFCLKQETTTTTW